jgi:hypothetical protein
MLGIGRCSSISRLVILNHRRVEPHMTWTTGVEAPSGRERQEACDVRASFKEVNCVHRYEVVRSTFGRRHQIPAGHFLRWRISNALDIFAFEYALSDRDHVIGCREVPMDAQERTQPHCWSTQSRGHGASMTALRRPPLRLRSTCFVRLSIARHNRDRTTVRSNREPGSLRLYKCQSLRRRLATRNHQAAPSRSSELSRKTLVSV